MTRTFREPRGSVVLCPGMCLAILVSVLLSACVFDSSPDVGSTPDEQLCSVLKSALLDDGTLASDLEIQLEAAAKEPEEVTGDLMAIAIAYRTWQSSYDQLGDYEPAIRFATRFVELANEDLIGPGELADKVVASALTIDAALEDGACQSG